MAGLEGRGCRLNAGAAHVRASPAPGRRRADPWSCWGRRTGVGAGSRQREGLLEDVLDLLAGLLEIAAGLIAFALGLQVRVIGGAACGLLASPVSSSTLFLILSSALMGTTYRGRSAYASYPSRPHTGHAGRGLSALTGWPA